MSDSEPSTSHARQTGTVVATEGECPFCHKPDDVCLYVGPLVRAFFDAFPVSRGHTLITPRRHVASWFDASDAERAEMRAAVEVVRGLHAHDFQPDGWNIGVNVGAAAGQTVQHVHLHM